MFKQFLKHVPGFRTGEKGNMIIASIYYISCLVFLIVGLIFFDSKDKVGCVKISGSAILFPAFIFSFTDNMNNMS
ncbi:hypothetical protein [Clostridium sp. C2-6-12]|uniref:hypothetical protein n=1 Tax=Clostridium sp. C2-6-12 TaxID=2698832 RepID=UPI00136FED86|nr:hypothetical protein [Clostridium sp. C2-6-12]